MKMANESASRIPSTRIARLVGSDKKATAWRLEYEEKKDRLVNRNHSRVSKPRIFPSMALRSKRTVDTFQGDTGALPNRQILSLDLLAFWLRRESLQSP